MKCIRSELVNSYSDLLTIPVDVFEIGILTFCCPTKRINPNFSTKLNSNRPYGFHFFSSITIDVKDLGIYKKNQTRRDREELCANVFLFFCCS